MLTTHYKNKSFIWTTIFCLILVILVFVFCISEVNTTSQLSNLEFTKLYDSYSGVPYEGERLSVANSKEIEKSFCKDWNQLPLSSEINSFISEYNIGNSRRKEIFNLLNINDGKWIFIDNGDTNFASQDSVYNFELYIYDSSNEKIYHYEFDM